MLRPCIIICCVVGLVGCSSSEPDSPQAASNDTRPAKATAATNLATKHPAAQAAHSFLAAACRGDVDTATSHLSPLAVEQFKLHGRTFSFPPIEKATFAANQVREAPGEEAAVQFALELTTPMGESIETEISCFMKRVENSWRVCGMAYDAGPNQPPVVFNYEQLKPAPRTTPPEQVVGKSPAATESPQTAQSPGDTQVR